ncbi:MAG: trimethylamine methyltransferase family protein [Candidatus Zixiibacteriota bacterium]|nr:MAG: trimethylamine methyltransferase family protein [candidate division Zixibacteria bacterium]
MRPTLRFLTDELIEKIITEARLLLGNLGVELPNDEALALLGDHGARVDLKSRHVWMTDDLIDKALSSAPPSVILYSSSGQTPVRLENYTVNFTPGSTAINILDETTGKPRRPNTSDYVAFARLMNGMTHIATQSTALIATDVPEKVSDSYRLYLSLLYCEKPIITGAFSIEAFEIMKDLQLAVRGSEKNLADKPLTMFSCCPTSPLRWSKTTSQNVIDCARYSIPVEFIAMPLSGFIAPVTIVGSLIQHTAETLSGVVLSQVARPGAPVVYGGSPAVFDIRYETTPMGDIGTMMTDCAYNEIGKHLNLPTQAYIGLSDAKLLDAQAGLESSMGATLAALSGINCVAGPGMLDFESCFSLEKLVIDNEICGMTYRMIEGIEPKDDFPAQPLFEELIKEQHLLIADHTRRWLKSEVHMPGPAIDRAQRSRWQQEGGLTLARRARREMEKVLAGARSAVLPEETGSELTRLMQGAARRHGMEKLPDLP